MELHNESVCFKIRGSLIRLLVLFDLILYVPVKNVSVMSALNQY